MIGGEPWFLLELPGQWTDADLNAPYQSGELLNYVREHYRGDIRYNAFLSKYRDPVVSHWMRFGADGDKDAYAAAYDNYWGTTSTTLIDYAIYDFNDDFNSPTVDYGVPPAHGFESIYPFVESVTINGERAETVPMVGAGPATFSVTFNRNMDTTIQPFVTFGPSPPHTDFLVHPIGGNDAGYNSNEVTFAVTLSQPASQTLSVDYATVDGTGIGGIDYEPTHGTLTFQPGETEHTISVPIRGNDREETSKTFFVSLSSPTFVTLSDSQGQGTLTDEDPTLSISDVSFRERDSGSADAVFNVTLRPPAGTR